MCSQNLDKLEENLKLRNKLLSLGICSSVIGPTGAKGESGEIGPTGPKGDPGPIVSSSNESLFFASFLETSDPGEMIFDDTWLIPNESKYFSLIDDNKVQIQPGIYEISFSSFLDNSDVDHGAEVYVKTDSGAAIKDLSYIFPIGSTMPMNFSQNILFRFEDVTILQVEVTILGDENTSNVTISNTTLLIKKIHE